MHVARTCRGDASMDGSRRTDREARTGRGVRVVSDGEVSRKCLGSVSRQSGAQRLLLLPRRRLAQVLLVDGPDLAERAVRLLALVGVWHLHRGRVPSADGRHQRFSVVEAALTSAWSLRRMGAHCGYEHCGCMQLKTCASSTLRCSRCRLASPVPAAALVEPPSPAVPPPPLASADSAPAVAEAGSLHGGQTSCRGGMAPEEWQI